MIIPINFGLVKREIKKGDLKMSYTVNQRVAIYRKMANLTQTEAAERLGMKCSTYSQMERKGNISVEKLMAIADVFGVNPAVLLRDPMELQSEKTAAAAEPAPEKTASVMHKPIFTPSSRPPFVVTRNEENLLTILRNLPKSDVDEIRSLINEKYQNSKKKK